MTVDCVNTDFFKIQNIQTKATTKSSPWSQMLHGAKYIGHATIAQIASVSIGLGLGRYTTDLIRSIYIPKAVPCNNYLEFIILTTGTFMLFIAVEEAIFRYGLQNICLTEVPKRLLQNIAPEYKHWINSTPAKIARIFISALAF